MAGLSKGMSVKDIANKHKVDIDALKKELKKGIKVEKEHTSDVKKATRIALDHLFEDPKYYSKLAKLNLEDIKVKLYPGGLGADVDYDEEEFKQLPTKTISLDQLVLNEPASKMKQPKSKATLKKLIKSIKAGDEIPPIIVRKLGDKFQILDGHHRYFAFKALDKDNIKAVVVDPKDVEILKENLNKDLVKEFMKHVMNELELDSLPPIKLSDDSQEAIDMRSWGGYQPSSKSIYIVTAKRHPADVFRTLAHELVHYKQDLEGRLKPGSGMTGSDDENEANSRAAVIMRNFAQAKPNLFEHLTNEGKFGDYLFGDKESGVKIGWYDSEKEQDTPAEKALFNLLKKYADSTFTEYTQINIDDLIPSLIQLKKDYPEILDTNLSDNAYIFRGTTLSAKELDAISKDAITFWDEDDNLVIKNQQYSSKRKLSSWSTEYHPAATFAVTSSDEKGGYPVVMKAKASDANLYFNPKFLSKLSTQPEKEVLNSTNPINVDIIVINLKED